MLLKESFKTQEEQSFFVEKIVRHVILKNDKKSNLAFYVKWVGHDELSCEKEWKIMHEQPYAVADYMTQHNLGKTKCRRSLMKILTHFFVDLEIIFTCRYRGYVQKVNMSKAIILQDNELLAKQYFQEHNLDFEDGNDLFNNKIKNEPSDSPPPLPQFGSLFGKSPERTKRCHICSCGVNMHLQCRQCLEHVHLQCCYQNDLDPDDVICLNCSPSAKFNKRYYSPGRDKIKHTNINVASSPTGKCDHSCISDFGEEIIPQWFNVDQRLEGTFCAECDVVFYCHESQKSDLQGIKDTPVFLRPNADTPAHFCPQRNNIDGPCSYLLCHSCFVDKLAAMPKRRRRAASSKNCTAV